METGEKASLYLAAVSLYGTVYCLFTPYGNSVWPHEINTTIPIPYNKLNLIKLIHCTATENYSYLKGQQNLTPRIMALVEKRHQN